jgi:hypothetical protein
MYKVDPISWDFVPYTKRVALSNNEDLFVDGSHSAHGAAVVALQDYPCKGLKTGDRCKNLIGLGYCDQNLDCINT